jgi:hypothetical protein
VTESIPPEQSTTTFITREPAAKVRKKKALSTAPSTATARQQIVLSFHQPGA